MTIASQLATAFVALVITLSTAQAQTAQDLLRQAKTLHAMCRGHMDDKDQQAAVCCGRAYVFARLNQLGWCYGKRGQTVPGWHRCMRNSYRNTSAEECEWGNQGKSDLPHELLFPRR